MRHRSIGALFAAAIVVTVAGSLPACGGSDFELPEEPTDGGDDASSDGLGDGTATDSFGETTSETSDDTTVETSGDSALDTDETDTGGSTDTSTDATDVGGDTSIDSGTDSGSDTGTDTGGCTAPVSCYGGAAAELTVPSTACRAGTSYCVSGTLGPCIGEVRPSTEACNGIDDDCNGTVDDGLGTISCGVGACANTGAACVAGKPGTCTPKPAASSETCGDGIDNNCNGLVDEGCGCVYVSSTLGNDSTGTGASSAPYKTIMKAISVAGTGGLAKQVCVASTATCGVTPATTTYSEAVTMKDGISVYGGYSPVGTTWPRAAGCTTAIAATDHNGVVFPSSVVSTTILDGFVVSAHLDPTNAAITVTGSTGAVISNNAVSGNVGTNSVGILVQDSTGTKATPLIRANAIVGGNGSASSIGIRSVNSAPVIRGNCSSFDSAGRCNVYACFGASLFVRGRVSGSIGGTTSTSGTYAVKLESSPGAIVASSAICSSDGAGDVGGVRITGNAAGTLIHQNDIRAPGGSVGNVNSVGVWMDPCAAASPWILDNNGISGQSRTVGGRADGVRAVGDCHPRVDSNLRIVGGDESANNDAIGVYCARDTSTSISSKCTILSNTAILGSGAGFPPNSTGVKCDAGACARIERNLFISGNQGVNTFGVVLNGASTFVERNIIDAGCTRGEGIGLLSTDSAGRVQNNVIRGGGSCVTGSSTTNSPTSTYGVRVFLAAGLKELDLHSNTVLALGGTTVACTSRGISFELTPGGAPPGGRGIVRNNILHAGLCATLYGAIETSASADPRIFESNDIWYGSSPTAIYRDENTTNLTTIASVNALTDMTVSGNFSSDPLFISAFNLHITSGSVCRNNGTATGAPTTDWEGDVRPQETKFDIGADEFKP